LTSTPESLPSPEPTPSPPFTRTPEFWALIACALALGVFGAAAGLAFLGVIGHGGKWYDDTNPRWFGGHWWWIAVTAAAGVVVGVLRRVTHLPEKLPSLVDDLQEEHVDARLVPGIVVVSAVSLLGGASLGPEKALGSMGAWGGEWLSRRRGLSEDDTRLNTLSGFAGAYGGLFSSTVIVVALIVEIASNAGQRYLKVLLGTIVASSVSFAIYFAIIGTVFLDAYKVPPYKFHSWQMLAGIPLGLFAVVLVACWP
jgi:H+/Cl- antiporter ClcA